jgi:hypothetical protein
MEFQGGKDQPNGCNRQKKPERNHRRYDNYVGAVGVNVQSAWQDTEPNEEGDYGEQSSANQMFEHGALIALTVDEDERSKSEQQRRQADNKLNDGPFWPPIARFVVLGEASKHH